MKSISAIILIGQVYDAFSFRTLSTISCWRRQQMDILVPLYQMSSSAIELGGEEEESNAPAFDFDFANAISKPLPEWFQKEKEEREKYLRDLEENRERLLREFKEKYEVTEKFKAQEREERWQRFQLKLQKRRKNWVRNLFTNTAEEDLETEATTREKWEKIWAENDTDEEEEEFILPGFFEVFPELKFKWPIWSKKNGRNIKCKTDSDCPFPQACCMHPILPGEKFCCTGFGKRELVPAYAPQEIARSPDTSPRDSDSERKRQAKKSWEPLDD